MNVRNCISLGLALFLVACGDDGGSGDGTTGADPATSTSNAESGDTDNGETGMNTTVVDMDTASMEEDSTAAAETGPACDNTDQTAIDLCNEMAQMEGTCEEVAGCVCGACVCELAECQTDAGCTAIRECAQMTGCTGLDCYMPETCQMVIDDNGGPVGPSASIALSLSTCTEAAMCPIQCDGGTGDSTGGDSGDSGGSDSSG